MSQKNVELKRLLNQYLGDAGVNNYMMVPPAHVMKVRDVSSVPMGTGSHHMSPTSSNGLPSSKLSRGRQVIPSQDNYRNTKGGGTMKRPIGIGGTQAPVRDRANDHQYSKTH